MLGSRSVEKGEAAVKDLKERSLPGTVELLQIDVSNEESILNAAKVVEEKYGRYVLATLPILITPPINRLISTNTPPASTPS